MADDQFHKTIPLLREPAGWMSGRNLITIPDYASPYCPETDMAGRNVQKRRGMSKLLNRRCWDTGLFLDNPGTEERQYLDVSGWAGAETNPWDLTNHTNWTIECMIWPTKPPKLGRIQRVLTQTHVVSGQTCWIIGYSRLGTGAYGLQATFTDSVGASSSVTISTSNPGNSGAVPEFDVPVHIAVTYDDNDLKLYINGVLEDTETLGSITWRSPATTDRVWVGARPYIEYGAGSMNPYRGGIAEIRLWSTDRSAAELLANYNKEVDPEDADWSSLECYLKCDDGKGGLVKDYSQHNRPALIHRGPPVPHDSLLSWDHRQKGLLFNGYQIGIVDCRDGDLLEHIRSGEKEWTVELFVSSYAHNHTGTNLPDECGLITFGDPDNPLFRIWLEDADNQIRAQVVVAGPTSYTLTSGVKPLDGMPVHIVLRRRQDEVELLINGVEVADATVGDVAGHTVAADNANNKLYVGWDNLAASSRWPGVIQELRIWNYSRTDEQISKCAWRRLPDTRDGPAGEGLLGYWPMSEVLMHTEIYLRLSSEFDATWSYSPLYSRRPLNADIDECHMRFYIPDTTDDLADLEASAYLAKWGAADVIRPRSAVIRAISQQQSVMSTGVFDRGDTAKRVRRTLIVHAGTTLLRQNGDRWDLIERDFDKDTPASFTTVGGYLVAANPNNKNVKTDIVEDSSPVGINVPMTGPTAAAGGAGSLTGGYYYKCVYVNSRTGRKSNGGPIDAAILVADVCDVTVYPSPDAQVDQIEIYRAKTTHGGDGIYRYVTTVSNEEQTYEDDTADTDLGDPISINYVQPPGCRYCAMYKNWLVLAGNPQSANTLYFTQAANFEAVSTEYEIGQDDGYPITGMFVLAGVLYICKERGIYAMQGDAPSTMSVVAYFPDRGLIAHHALAPFENAVAFVDHDGMYVFDGAGFTKISEPVDDWFDGRRQRLNPDKLAQCCAAPHPQKRQLWFSLNFGDPDPPYGDLVGLWRLDKDPTGAGGNEARDMSGRANHLASHGTMTSADLVAGPFGPNTALEFDGSDDYLELTNEKQMHGVRGTMSVGAWVKLNSAGAAVQIILSEWDNNLSDMGWRLCYRNTTNGWVFYLDTAANVGKTVGVGIVDHKLAEWQFVVATFDGNYIRLWVDGLLADSTVLTTGDQLIHPVVLRIGAQENDGTPEKFFDGAISRAFVTETVLQEAQIAALYEAGKSALAGEQQYAQEQKTFVYQHDTGLWSLQDKGYSALALIETDDGQKLVGADGRNFVYELDVTETDGATMTNTLCGIVTASGVRTLTCANAAFSTYQDGLAGLMVRVYNADDELVQTRRILSNTATVLTVDEDWSPSDIVGYEFVLAGIGWRYQTPVLHFGDIVREKIPRTLSLVQEANDARSLRDDNGYNMCPNGLLDEWTGTVPTDWAKLGTPTTSQVADPPTSDTRYACRVETTNAANGLACTFNVIPETDYIVRFWYKTASASEDTLRFVVKDVTGDTILDPKDYLDSVLWAEHEHEFTTPAGCVEVRLQFQEDDSPGNAADFRIGEVLFLRAADDDLPRPQKVRCKVAKELAAFEDADDADNFIDLTDGYQRQQFDDARAALIQIELSNKYPGQPVEIHAADLDIELTEVERAGD